MWIKSKAQGENSNKKNSIFKYLWLYCVVLTFVCQFLIYYPNWEAIALSVLIGIGSTLAGIFAALLAFPYNDDEEKRFSKIGTVIVTLITGYLLAKFIDPLLADAIKNFKNITEIRNMANFLVAFIGLLQGFITTYQYRAPKLNNFEGNTQLPEN